MLLLGIYLVLPAILDESQGSHEALDTDPNLGPSTEIALNFEVFPSLGTSSFGFRLGLRPGIFAAFSGVSFYG